MKKHNIASVKIKPGITEVIIDKKNNDGTVLKELITIKGNQVPNIVNDLLHNVINRNEIEQQND